MKIDFEYEVTLPNADEIIQKLGLGDHGDVQKFIDEEVIRISSPYVPHDKGRLEQSAQRATDFGSGDVVYDTEYARFQWYGMLMLGEVTNSPWANAGEKKYLTLIPLKYQGSPMRGAHWVERAMDAGGMDELVEEVQKFITERNK